MNRRLSSEQRTVAAATTLGLGALAGLAAYALLQPQSAPGRAVAGALGRPVAPPAPRMADDAPGRTARRSRFGDYAVTGRSVTIDRSRDEVYAFVRDVANLARFMENIEAVTDEGGQQTWTIRAPLGRSLSIVTRLVNERQGEQFAWRTTVDSQVEGEGKFSLRDAPAGRGTIVESVVAYKPPGGQLGQLAAKLFQAEPAMQTRRDLKRLKMLLETGEVATNVNQRDEANKASAAAREDA